MIWQYTLGSTGLGASFYSQANEHTDSISLGISWVTEQILASQEELYCIEFNSLVI
jgi:hypothetical protein